MSELLSPPETETRRIAEFLGIHVRGPFVSTAGAIIATLVLCATVIAALGANPLTAFQAIAVGAVGGESQIGETLQTATPLILTGIAAAIPFSAHLWNIG